MTHKPTTWGGLIQTKGEPSGACFKLSFIMEFSNSPPALMSDAARTQKVPHGNHRCWNSSTSVGNASQEMHVGHVLGIFPKLEKKQGKSENMIKFVAMNIYFVSIRFHCLTVGDNQFWLCPERVATHQKHNSFSKTWCFFN